MSSPNTQKRYPGVKPFETSERDLFFGRDRDIEDLLDLVWLEKLVVLFGKSGYGKSSLINAGILPEIEAEAVPVVVRLGSYVAGQTPVPLDNLRLKINEVLNDNPEAAFLDALNLPPTLWQQVKRKQSPQQRRFVLIFDQFEEFFTYPLAEQQAFKEQIADLLYTEVPQAVRNQNDTLSASQQVFIASAFDAKVLLAIRADRMSLLDSMKDKLPSILQKRYELKGLSEAQAREAIVGPAQREGDFVSPVFAYSPEALKVMTQKLAASKSSQRSGIEAFQLQILCEYLEDKVIKGEIPGQRVEPQHFAEQIDEIFEGYYQRLLDKLEPGAQEAAQLLIEEKLLFEDANTGEARRLGVDSGVLLAEKGISQALLNQLESNFLLRRESTSTGGFNYEISHDTLIAPILKSKAERKALERVERERVEARRRRNRLLFILGVTGLALAVVIGVMVYVLKLRNDAIVAKNEAEKAKTEAIAERDKARKALEDKEVAEFQDVYQRADNILNSAENNCPGQEMIAAIDTMQVRYPKNQALQAQIEAINQKLRAKIAGINKEKMKKIGFIVLLLWGGQLARLSAQPCNTFECAFQKAEQILKTSTAKDKYEKVLANLDDAEEFAGSDKVKMNKIRVLRNQAFEKIQKEKEIADKEKDRANNLAENALNEKNRAEIAVKTAQEQTQKAEQAKLEAYIQTEKANKEKLRADSIAEANRRQTLNSYANDLDYKSQIALREGKRTEAFQIANYAHQYVEAGNIHVTRALVRALYYSDVSTPSLPWASNFDGHTLPVTSVAFSPDGKKLATGSEDRTAKIWDISSGKQIISFEGHTLPVTSVAFSPDGKKLATGSEDKTAKIWELQTGKQILNIHGHKLNISCIAFSLDGKSLVTGSSDGTVKIWNLQTGKQALELLGHTAPVWSVAFSPDGRRLVTGSEDKSARIWNIHSGRQTIELLGHSASVRSVAFSPDGKRLATGSEDSTAIIWNLQTGKQALELLGHTAPIWSVIFAPDGNRLATGSRDQSAIIWNLQSGEQSLELHGHTSYISSIAFSPNGKNIATGSYDKSAKIWNLQYDKQTLELLGHKSYVRSVAFSPDGKKIATGSEDKSTKIWDIQSGETVLEIQDIASIWGIAFSPDGKSLITGSSDSTAKIWNLQTGKIALKLQGHKGHVRSVAFSPDGNSIGTGSQDKSAKIWDLKSGEPILELLGHKSYVRSVAFSPDGKRFATGSSDSTAKIWDLKSGELVLELQSGASIWSVAFSPDGSKLATGEESSAKIWDIISGKLIIELPAGTSIWSVTFSPDGHNLATGSYNENVKIWDIQSGKLALELLGHRAFIYSIAFSPDGKKIATGSGEYGAKIWEIHPENIIQKANRNGHLSPISGPQLISYNLETLLDLHPDNEAKLIATREVWQIKAFADLAAAQAGGSNVLNRVEAPYSRANRLYAAALALQDELLIKMDWAKMLRKWAAVYRDDGKEVKAKELEGKADGLWKEEK